MKVLVLMVVVVVVVVVGWWWASGGGSRLNVCVFLYRRQFIRAVFVR